MGSEEVALGILASGCTVYGFVLAYYAFARTLYTMEIDRYERILLGAEPDKWQYTLMGNFTGPPLQFRKETITKELASILEVWKRRKLLDVFLLLATAAFAFSALGDLLVIGAPLMETPPSAVPLMLGFFFAPLLALVIALGGYVGYMNLGETRIQIAKTNRDLQRFKEAPLSAFGDRQG